MTDRAYAVVTGGGTSGHVLPALAVADALVAAGHDPATIRYLGARPHENYDIEALMQTFGRIRVDVDNCLRELVNAGVVRTLGHHPVRYQFARPADPEFGRLLEDFLTDRPGESAEDRSPAIQRFREMIGRDEKMMVIFESIRTVAKTDLAVLVLGLYPGLLLALCAAVLP